MNDSPMLLIIDDSITNSSVLATLFKKCDYRVATAQNGEDGLSRASQLLPDLILLDVVMPGIDGFEVCERLKEREDTRDIPVIFMTALAATEHKVKGFRAGGVDYLTKPLQIDEVLARVETQLKLRLAQKQLIEQNALLNRQRDELERRVEERAAELVVREKVFRTLAENSPDYINRLDCQCRFVYVNPRFEAMVGLTCQEVEGKTPSECFPGNPFSADYQSRVMEMIVLGLEQYEYEATVQVPDSEMHYHSISFVAEHDDEGNVTGVLAIGRDITELKRKERELLLLSLAVNTSSESAFLMNQDGRFVYVNDEACRSLGYSRDELLTMTPLDIDPVITAGQFRKALHSVFLNGSRIGSVESVHRTKDGRTFPIELFGSAVMLDGENYCLTMGRDISARKRAEQALAESEREFRTLAEHHPDGIVRLDPQGRHLFANPTILHTTGLSAEELSGKTICELNMLGNQDTLWPVLDACLRVVDEGEANDIEFIWPCGDISEIRHIPEFDEQGELVSVLAISRDITERKRSEKMLHEQQQAIRAVLENSPDAVLRYDRDFRRVYVNAAMQRVFGVSAEQLIGTVLPLDSPLEKPESYRRLILEVFETGEEQREEFSFVLHGNMRWADLRFAPEFDAQGQVASVVVVGRDITERRETERLLREERGLFVSGPTVVFKWRAEEGWPVEYVSPNVFEQFGYTVEALTDGSILFAAIIHPDDLERVASEVGIYTEEDSVSFAQEYRILHANGSYRWIYDYTTINREADGSISSFHGYVLDITARKSAEDELARYRGHLEELVEERTAALQESEAMLRALIDNLPFEFWAMDRNLCYTMQNSASIMNYGSVVGKGLDKLGLPPEIVNIWREQDERVLAGEILRSEYEKEVAGEQRMFESLVAPVAVNDNVVGIVGVGMDVTKRKRAEQKLMEALTFSEGIINAIPDLLFELDESGRYLNVWTHRPELLATQREILLGNTVADVLEAESAAIVMAALREASIDGISLGRVIWIDLPVGRHWFELSVSRRAGEGRSCTRFLVLSRDVTERKQHEDQIRRLNVELEQRVSERTAQLEAANTELRESEQRFRTLAENFPDFLVRFDSECHLTYVNPVVAIAFATPAEVFVGQRLMDMDLFGQKVQAVELEASIRQVFETGKPNEHEACWATVHGEAIFEIRHMPEKDAAGNTISVIGIGRNVTRLRAIEQALRTSEREFRTLAANAPDIIVRYDRQCRRIYVNPAFVREIAIPQEQMCNMPVEKYWHTNATVSAEEYAGYLRHVMNTGDQADILIAWQRRDGQSGNSYHSLRMVAEYDDEGNVIGALSIGRNITALIEAEQRLEESHAELQELASRRETAREQERKYIARELHDELGQYLTALALSTSALDIEFAGENTVLAEKLLKMRALVDDTKQVARRLSQRLRPAALDMGIDAALEWLVNEFTAHTDALCELSLQDDIVLRDSSMIVVFRIVQESLTNIARYAGASSVKVSLRQQEDTVVLKVHDDGKGFVPSEKQVGSFGLIGMRERLLAVGGKLDVISEPDCGTRIVAYIPVGEEEEEDD